MCIRVYDVCIFVEPNLARRLNTRVYRDTRSGPACPHRTIRNAMAGDKSPKAVQDPENHIRVYVCADLYHTLWSALFLSKAVGDKRTEVRIKNLSIKTRETSARRDR